MARLRLMTLLIGVLGAGALWVPAVAAAASSSTDVTCSPSQVSTGAPTTCTATVADTSGVSPPPIPGGKIKFTSSPSTGTFSSSSACTLDANGSCQVNFTPSAGGNYTITANYQGNDGTHTPSTGTSAITAVNPTTTSLTCSASSVSINSSTDCTATLSGASGGGPPVGTVTFSSSPGTGSFGSPSCQAAGSGATCSATFTPSAAGGYTLTATYSGDTFHSGSHGSFPLTATTAPAGGGPGSHGGSTGTLTISISNGPPAPGTVALAPRAAVTRRHVAALLMSCKGSRGTRCTGTLVLTSRVKVKVVTIVRRGKKRHRKTTRSSKTILVGLVTYNLAAGSTNVIRMRLSKAAVKALTRARSRGLRAPALAGGVAIGSLRLIGPKHKKHHKKHKRHKKH